MRIALTIHALDGGGAERVLCQLARRWASKDHQVHVITWTAKSKGISVFDSQAEGSANRHSNIQHHGLDLMQLSKNRWQGLRANLHRVQALRSTLQELQPDLILSFCDQMNISTLQAARGLAVPVWIAERSDPAKQKLSRLWELWRRITYHRCSGCIAQTEDIADYLSRWIPRKRIHVIPNAVNSLTSPATPPHTAAQSQLPRSHPETPVRSTQDSTNIRKTILGVGRLSHEKGWDVLLSAWQQVQDELPDWGLRIVGEGPLRTTLERRAVDLKRVQFSGWVSEVEEAYSQAHLFVLASRYEGFPNALLEAMSHSLPCIATNCSQAIDELSSNGQALCRIPVDDANSMAEAIRQLNQAPQQSVRLGINAQKVSRNYSWELVGPMWDKILESQR